MTLPSTIECKAQYGGDFRVGSRGSAPVCLFVGDSRMYGLKGDLTHQVSDYITLNTFNGQSFVKKNRAWPSLTAERAISDPIYSVDAAEQVLDGLAFNAPLNIVVVGPIGVNDLSFNGTSIANIKAYNEALCKLYRNLGCKVVYISEVSAGTTVGGVTGDDVKNHLRAWAIAGGAGNEYWRTFADAYVDPGYYAPWGQNGGGTYGTSGSGYLQSRCYDVDAVHWNNTGHQEFAAILEPIINTLIDDLDTANFVKPELPSLLSVWSRMKAAEDRLDALES